MRLVLVLLTVACCGTLAAAEAPVKPLPNAHAHNDYLHTRPLYDALDHGFCSVEADIWLVDGKLLVAHDSKDLKPDRTLESLYLAPLRERVRKNGGRVYRGGPECTLLIDIKSDGDAIYPVLRAELKRYSDIFSEFRKDGSTHRALTAILSGNEPKKLLTDDPVRYAGLDGRLPDLGSGASAELMPWISASWLLTSSWRGNGPIPETERAKVKEITRRAHEAGQKVRFWATPDKPEVWRELRADGVDILNADDLAGLQRFLLDAR